MVNEDKIIYTQDEIYIRQIMRNVLNIIMAIMFIEYQPRKVKKLNIYQ